MLYVICGMFGATLGAIIMGLISGGKMADTRCQVKVDSVISDLKSKGLIYCESGVCVFKCPKNYYSCCMKCPIGNTCLVSCGYACKEE